MDETPITPEQVEQAIRATSNRIATGVKVCSDRYRTFLTVDHEYDLAYARAYMAHDGPAHEKKYAAELATADERAARDAADVAYRYADRTAKALELELRAYQSVNASVRTIFSVAGRGEH